jgi:hypothetical protein
LIETGEPLWDLIDPQVEIEPDPFGPFGGRTYVGHEGLQNWGRDITEVATEAWSEIDDVIDAGDVVVVLGRNWTRGRYSEATGGELVVGLPFAWGLSDTRRATRPSQGLSTPSGGPRSRRAAGVGDVAGERGGGARPL